MVGGFLPWFGWPRLAARAAALAILVLLTAPGAIGRPHQGPEDATQQQIEDAINNGANYLLKRQQLDGSWRPDEHKYVSGQTGLAMYTLIKSGVSPRHPSILRGLAYLRAHPPRHTYGIACCLMALHAADPTQHLEEIATWTELLLECQGQGFSYPGGHEDLSLTQYGCLGMRVAEASGLEISTKIWEQCIDYALNIQRDDGSFSYKQGTVATGSMTAAGVAILELGRQALEAKGDLSKRDARVIATAIDEGIDWLATNMRVDRNPDPASENDNAGHMTRWHLYYLYGLERVGGLTGRAEFGPHDWYKQASNYLVKNQHETGRWGTAYGETHPGTCFGVLVLKRATSPTSGLKPRGAKSYGVDDPEQPLSIRVTGDTPLTAWVSSWGDRTREQHEWDKEIGKGPRLWRIDYVNADTGEVLASAEGDPQKPSRGERYAVQFSMSKPGKHRVVPKAYVRPIDDDEGEQVELLSPTLEVLVDGVMTPSMREAIRDLDRDELDKTQSTCRASSAASNSHPARYVRDGSHGHGWLSGPNDAQPWISLEPDRPQRADHVVLSPYFKAPDERSAWGRAKRVLLEVNRSEVGEFEIDPDLFGKAYLPLPKTKVIRELKVTILEIAPGTGGGNKTSAGLAEIELQRRPDLVKQRKAAEKAQRKAAAEAAAAARAKRKPR